MGEEIEARNRSTLERLRAIGSRLTEDELTRIIDAPWTAAALFAHMGFWDRFTHVRWVHTMEAGGQPVPVDDMAMELVNGAALGQWGLIPPRAAVEETLAAAAAVNELIESLDPDAVAEVLRSGRERLVNRSIHRSEHLLTIEGAFPEP